MSTDMRSQNQESIQIDKLDGKLRNWIQEIKPYVKEWNDSKEKEILKSWINKLQSVIYNSIIDKKNRNLYAQILCHIVKRGKIKEPFNSKPTNGKLPTIPAYMSSYLDETSSTFYRTKEPGWLQGEEFDESVLSTVSVSDESYVKYKDILSPRRKEKFMLSTDIFEEDSLMEPNKSAQRRINFHDEDSNELEKVLRYDKVNDEKQNRRNTSTHALQTKRDTSPSRTVQNYAQNDKSIKFMKASQDIVNGRLHEDVTRNTKKHERRKTAREEYEKFYRKYTVPVKPHNYVEYADNPYTAEEKTNFASTKRASLSREKELELKVRLLEGKVQEETLKIQQQHDQMVKKILDRKNNELGELRQYYNNKISDLEKEVKEYDKKVSLVSRELTQTKEKHASEVSQMKDVIKKTSSSTATQYEKMMYDKVSEIEKEMFEQQKTHRQKLQEVVQEAKNEMETIKLKNDKEKEGLVAKVQSLTESLKLKQELEEKMYIQQRKLLREKEALQETIDKKNVALEDADKRITSLEKENKDITEEYGSVVKDLREKSEKAFDDMNRERNIMKNASSSVITGLESKIAQYRQTIQDTESNKQRQLQEKDTKHKDEILQLKLEHDKKIRDLKFDYDKHEMQYQSTIAKYEIKLREKEDEIKKLDSKLILYKEETDMEIEKFKTKTEEQSSKIFSDLTKQLETLQEALVISKEKLEQQRIEYTRNTENQKLNFRQQFEEYKESVESEKLKLRKNFEEEKQELTSTRQHEKEEWKAKEDSLLKEFDLQLMEQRKNNGKVVQDLENQIRTLREEVIQANSLRKEQIQEISHLRDEERNAAKRNETALHNRLKVEEEQMKLQLQQEHSKKLNEYTEKMEKRLKDLSLDYSEKSKRDTASIDSLSNQINQLKEESTLKCKIYEKKLKQRDDEKKKYQDKEKEITRELETLNIEHKHQEKKYANLELTSQEKISRCRLECEEKLQGMLPLSVKQELEETIDSLRQQVSVLECRAKLLQEQLNENNQYAFIRDGAVTSRIKVNSEM